MHRSQDNSNLQIKFNDNFSEESLKLIPPNLETLTLISNGKDINGERFQQFITQFLIGIKIKNLQLINFKLDINMINSLENTNVENIILKNINKNIFENIKSNPISNLVNTLPLVEDRSINLSLLKKNNQLPFSDAFILDLYGIKMVNSNLVPRDQIGPRCGYYSLSYVLSHFSLMKQPGVILRHPTKRDKKDNESIPSLPTLKQLGASIGILGDGGIFDVNDFAALVEKAGLKPLFLHITQEQHFLNTICDAVDLGIPVILPYDIRGGTGENAHYALIVGYRRIENNGLDFILIHQNKLEFITAEKAFTTNQSLQLKSPRSYEYISNTGHPKKIQTPMVTNLADTMRSKLLIALPNDYLNKIIDQDKIKNILSFIVPYQSYSVQCARGELTPEVCEELKDKKLINKENINGKSLFYIACEKGQLEMAKLLMSFGADINKPSYNGRTPFWAACRGGHVPIIKFLLANKVLTSHDKQQQLADALYVVCEKGHLEAFQFLITLGASVNANAHMRDGWTPFLRACEKGHIKIVELLIKKIADINHVNGLGETPLYVACATGQCEVVNLLIKNGAMVDKADKKGNSPLAVSAMNNQLAVAEVLIKQNAQMNKPNKEGWIPLHIAVEKGNFKIVELLIKYNADINQKNNGCTPIYIASTYGHFEIVELLIKHKVNVNQPDEYGYTPLSNAIFYGHAKIANFLLTQSQVKVDIDLPAKADCKDIIEKANQGGKGEEMKYLLNKRKKYQKTQFENNQTYLNSFTPLFCAVLSEENEVVKSLLDNGANINIKADGISLIEFAQVMGNIKIINLLDQHLRFKEQPKQKKNKKN